MDESRRAAPADYRSFQSALDHLFQETEKHLQLDRGAGGSNSQRALPRSRGTHVSPPVIGGGAASDAHGIFLDSAEEVSLVDEPDDEAEPEEAAARGGGTSTPPSPHAHAGQRSSPGAWATGRIPAAAAPLGASHHSSSGRDAGLRVSSGANTGSRRRAHSSGRHAVPAYDAHSYDAHLAAGSAYQRAQAMLPLGLSAHPYGAPSPLPLSSGLSHHELELLQRVEHVRASVEHYRAASEQQARQADVKLRSQLHALMGRLDVQLAQVEERLTSHYSNAHSISLSHTLEFRKKIKKDVRDAKAEMEAWRTAETAKLEELVRRTVAASTGNSPGQQQLPLSPSRAGTSPSGGLAAPLQVLQLQQQAMADRQEILALKISLEQQQQQDAAYRGQLRDEMDDMRAEMKRMLAHSVGSTVPTGIASSGSGGGGLSVASGVAAALVSPKDAPPTRSELQNLQGRFHGLEHSISALSVDLAHLQQSHQSHLEHVEQRQSKTAQRLQEHEEARENSEGQVAQQITDLQAQVASLQAAAASAQVPVSDLLASTLTKLDDEVGDLAGRVDALEEAREEAAARASVPAGRPPAADSVPTSPSSDRDMRARLSEMDRTMQSLTERVESLAGLPAALDGVKASQHSSDASAAQFRQSTQEELADVLEQMRHVERQLAAVEAERERGVAAATAGNDANALQFVQVSGELRTLRELVTQLAQRGPPSVTAAPAGPTPEISQELRAVLDSLQQQADDLADQLGGALEEQRAVLDEHDDAIQRLLQHAHLSSSNETPRPVSGSVSSVPSIRSGHSAQHDDSEEADEVSSDLGRGKGRLPRGYAIGTSDAGPLAVQIPKSRPGSSQSEISTHSVHPLADGFASARGATSDGASNSTSEEPTLSSTSLPPPLPATTSAASVVVARGERETPPSAADRPAVLQHAIASIDSDYDADFVEESPSSDTAQHNSPVKSTDPKMAAEPASSSAAVTLTTERGVATTVPSSLVASVETIPVPAPALPTASAPVVAPVTFRPSHTATCNTASDFAQLRRELRAYGVDRLVSDQVKAGWFALDGNGVITIAASEKPFNPFARLASGALVPPYGDLLTARGVGAEEPAATAFMMARNRPELDAQWASSDQAWIGKASMAQRHEFMLLRDLSHWRAFNVSTLALQDARNADSVKLLRDAIVLLDSMERVALAYTRLAGWSDDIGLYFHAYPFNSVQALHLHVLDRSVLGPTFHQLNHKNLPLTAVRQVLQEELADLGEPEEEEKQTQPHKPSTSSSVLVSDAFDEEDSLSDRAEAEDASHGQSKDSDASDEFGEEAQPAAAVPRVPLNPAAAESVRAALRRELDGKRLELQLSCDELPVSCTAVLVCERSSVAGDAATDDGFVRRGWSEVVEGSKAPEFERRVHITFHDHQRAGAQDKANEQAQPQELRVQLFDASSSAPRLLGSTHVLLEDLVFELGEQCSFPLAGFDHSPNVGDTPSVTLRASLALASEVDEQAVDDALRTPKMAGRPLPAPAMEEDGTADHSSFVSADASHGDGPTVVLLLRALNLPWRTADSAVLTLSTQDARVSPRSVDRSDTQPPSSFCFLARTTALRSDAEEEAAAAGRNGDEDEEAGVEALFREPLEFRYVPGHILKLSLYEGDSASEESMRLGSVFVRHDDLFDAAEDAADERRQLMEERRAGGTAAEQETIEETVRELTFYLQHEDPEKNEALANVELIIEAQLQELSPHSSRTGSPRQSAASASKLGPSHDAHARPLLVDESVRHHGTSGFVQSHRVRISVSCRGLPLTKASGECDPIVAAFMQRQDAVTNTASAPSSDALEYVSQTEWLRSTRDPDFADAITLVHSPFRGQLLKLSVYDVSSEAVSDEERIGGVLVKLDDILLSASLSSSLSESRAAQEEGGMSAAARGDARQALLDGVGNEMVYVLLHENPAKNAALAGATICIRYDATDLDEHADFPPEHESEAAAGNDTHDESSFTASSASHTSTPNKSMLHRQSHEQNLEVTAHSAHNSPSGRSGVADTSASPAVGASFGFGSSNVSRPSIKLAAAAASASAAGGADSRHAINSLLSDIATGQFSDDDEEDEDESDDGVEEPHRPLSEDDEEAEAERYAASPFASPSPQHSPAGGALGLGVSGLPSIPKLNFAAALRGDSQAQHEPLQRRELPPRKPQQQEDSEDSIEEEFDLDD